MPVRPPPLLTRLRRRLRHAWFLHAVLLAAFLLLPMGGRLARAEEEEFILRAMESSVTVNVWAPEGTEAMEPGTSRQVIASVQFNTWEVWTGSLSGTTEIRYAMSTPIVGDSLSFTASGDGAVSPATAIA